jgi:hypothetical protein
MKPRAFRWMIQAGLLAGALLALTGCANMDWDSLKAGARRMHEQNQDRYGDDYPKKAADAAR